MDIIKEILNIKELRTKRYSMEEFIDTVAITVLIKSVSDFHKLIYLCEECNRHHRRIAFFEEMVDEMICDYLYKENNFIHVTLIRGDDGSATMSWSSDMNFYINNGYNIINLNQLYVWEIGGIIFD